MLRAHHLALRVRDVARAAHFYEHVIGLSSLPAPREGVAWFQLGEAILMIEPHAGDAGPIDDEEAPGLHLLSFAITADARAHWEQRLTQRGVTVTHRTDYSLYFRDPEGNRLALSHYPERARGEPTPTAADHTASSTPIAG